MRSETFTTAQENVTTFEGKKRRRNHSTSPGSPEKHRLNLKNTALGLLTMALIVIGTSTLTPRTGELAQRERTQAAQCETAPETIAKAACFGKAHLSRWRELARDAKLAGKLYVHGSISRGKDSLYQANTDGIELSDPQANLNSIEATLQQVETIDLEDTSLSLFLYLTYVKEWKQGPRNYILSETNTSVFLPRTGEAQSILYVSHGTQCTVIDRQKPGDFQEFQYADVTADTWHKTFEKRQGVNMVFSENMGPRGRYTSPLTNRNKAIFLDCLAQNSSFLQYLILRQPLTTD